MIRWGTHAGDSGKMGEGREVGDEMEKGHQMENGVKGGRNAEVKKQMVPVDKTRGEDETENMTSSLTHQTNLIAVSAVLQ